MNFRRQRSEEISVNLTPLIDVVFLLLIFFMVSTTFSRETQLQLDLPRAESGQPAEEQDIELIELVISADGDILINDRALVDNRSETLKRALQGASGGNTALPVVITADANTPHQMVITVMDAAGQLGFNRLRLTTMETEAEPVP